MNRNKASLHELGIIQKGIKKLWTMSLPRNARQVAFARIERLEKSAAAMEEKFNAMHLRPRSPDDEIPATLPRTGLRIERETHMRLEIEQGQILGGLNASQGDAADNSCFARSHGP